MVAHRWFNPLGAIWSYLHYTRDRLRLQKLMSRGLKIGRNVYIMEDVAFDLNYPFLIEIGDYCRISKDVRILAHDATTFRELGITRIARVRILEGSFIGERAIILPGVTIGPHAMIAAGAVVNRDIAPGKAAAGNPARPYCNCTDLLHKYRDIARGSEVFDKQDIECGLIGPGDLVRATGNGKGAFLRGIPHRDPYYVNADMAHLRELTARAYAMHFGPGSEDADAPVDAETQQLEE